VDRAASITHVTSKRLDYIIIAMLAVAIGLFAFDRFSPRSEAPAQGPIAQSAAAPKTTATPPAPQTEPTIAVDDKSIAVLPFVNMSSDKDQEYFSDGMAEEILNALAQVPDLKVAGRTSSFYFKGKDQTLRAIGSALGVAHVLEGSVRKQGDQVRITVQLIRVDNGFHLWSQSYDGALQDVFELQERIAREITGSLKVVLAGGEEMRLAPKTTQNTEAHQQYLRGKFFFNQRGYANLQNAATAFKAALELDQDYADAWAGLAQTLALMPIYSSYEAERTEWKDTRPEALVAAEHALRLQPDSSDALAARAWVRMHQLDWAGAEADFQAAIRRNPRDATAQVWYGIFFMDQRRWREAATQLDEAVALDPLSPNTHLVLGQLRNAQGDFTGALPHYEEALRLSPGLYLTMVNKVLCLVELGNYGPASTAAQDLPGAKRNGYLSVIAALQHPSRVDEAVRQLQSHPLGSTNQAWAFAKLGQNELALAELERMVREGEPSRIWLYRVPEFKSLYADPRFQALVRQMGLPEVGAEEVR
jgi:TolB-like protein